MADETSRQTLGMPSLTLPPLKAGVHGLRFLEAFVRSPRTVGSLWPSSPQLSRTIVQHCDFDRGDTVVELGPGTGAFTALLLDRLREDGRLVALEISSTNIEILRRRFTPCEIIHDSAEHMARYVSPGTARCVVSGLAWGMMPDDLQDRILGAVRTTLSPGGQFVAFGYVHASGFPATRRFKERLSDGFGRVERSRIVWRNIPPAYVYRCWRD